MRGLFHQHTYIDYGARAFSQHRRDIQQITSANHHRTNTWLNSQILRNSKKSRHPQTLVAKTGDPITTWRMEIYICSQLHFIVEIGNGGIFLLLLCTPGQEIIHMKLLLLLMLLALLFVAGVGLLHRHHPCFANSVGWNLSLRCCFFCKLLLVLTKCALFPKMAAIDPRPSLSSVSLRSS